MEFYTTWDKIAPWNLLAKAGLLAERERLPVKTLLFVLRKAGFRSPGGTLQLSVAGRPVQQIWFDEVCLWEQKPEPWWDEVPGLMAMYPLTNHGLSPRNSVRRAAEIIEARTPDSIRRATMLTTLNILGKIAYPKLDLHAIIPRDLMKESPFFKELAAEIRVEETRQAILDILDERFGASAEAAVAADVNRIEDLTALRELFRLTIRCPGLDEFRAELTVRIPPPRKPKCKR